jgi:hypothetical protein
MDGCSGWQIKGDRETSHSATIIKVAEFSFACGISLKEVAIVKNLSRLRGLADSGMAHEITSSDEIGSEKYSVRTRDPE